MTSQTTVARHPDTESALDMLFVVDELSTLQPGHDTSVALMEAAQLRGHQVLVTSASGLGYQDGVVTARCHDVTLRPAVLHGDRWITDKEWFRLGEARDYSLEEAQVVFMRTDPPVDVEYLRATYLLDFIDPERTIVVNSPRGLREANEHLFALRVPELSPPTLVSADARRIRDTVAAWGRAVLKPTDGMAGRGVLILAAGDPNLSSIVDIATDRGRVQVLVQQWVPACADGDRRVIVLDGTPIGSVRRVAGDGEFRCNMATGAAPLADEVTDLDRDICAELAPHLRAHGLVFVGIDVIGDRLTEVNVTSPTGLREIDALSGTQLAADVVAWVEANCPARFRRG